jgi:uncharacterized protein YebE (UPF0316 family)
VFPELILSASLIAVLRIFDVSLGTLRSIFVIQSRKYVAALTGFFEVLIWIFAMRYIVQHMDHEINLIGYAGGFAIGTFLGVTIDQKLGFSYIQISMFSKGKGQLIADALRDADFGATILPGVGAKGDVLMVFTVINRNRYNELKKIVNNIDSDIFINVQPASPFRGYLSRNHK